jgi:two-component system, cell cycle response regulator DivK
VRGRARPSGEVAGERAGRALDMTRVAVVEDNADNRLLLQALLGEQYELVEFDNGVDALAGMAASLPDLVLLDISLPGMDGNEILSRIREDERLRPLPVIALTAHAMAGDREKYLAAGFNDYITKPIVDETLLISAIEYWLAKR